MSKIYSAESNEYKKLIWNDELVSRFWKWQSTHPENYFTNILGHKIAKNLGKWFQSGQTVLDYGCGLGFLCKHLAMQGVSVYATDFSREAIAKTIDRNKGVQGFLGAKSIEEFKKENKRFDVIVSVEVIEHLSLSEREVYFNLIRDFLKPDGIAIITTPNNEDLSKSELYCPCCEHTYHRWQHMYSFCESSLRDICQQSGFDIVRSYTTDFSMTMRDDPLWYLKRVIKQVISKPLNDPHLVCVIKPS